MCKDGEAYYWSLKLSETKYICLQKTNRKFYSPAAKNGITILFCTQWYYRGLLEFISSVYRPKAGKVRQDHHRTHAHCYTHTLWWFRVWNRAEYVCFWTVGESGVSRENLHRHKENNQTLRHWPLSHHVATLNNEIFYCSFSFSPLPVFTVLLYITLCSNCIMYLFISGQECSVI